MAMDPKASSASGASGVSGGASGKPWEDLIPKHVDHEDRMSPTRVKRVWESMYTKAGLTSASEDVKKAFRLAVYCYAAINGTSRAGAYSGEFQLFDGKVVPASVIPQSTGSMEIRQFFRGCQHESYYALKESGVLQANPDFVAKAAGYGVSAACCFAIADWFHRCPYLTPLENAAHDAVRTNSLQKSRRNRDGKSLEDVEDDRRQADLETQGPLHNSGNGFTGTF